MFCRSITVFAFAFLLAGCSHFAARSPAHKKSAATPQVTMLLYHHIAAVPESMSAQKRRWTVTPQKFEEHLDWLAARGYHPVTLREWLAHVKTGAPLPEKPVIITFDDGWMDQYENALPVLKKRGFRATFFIVTESVSSSVYMTWKEVLELEREGMDMQSHTRTHSRLPVLSREQAREEIAGSKLDLENRLEKPVTVLAYPYGSYDDDIISLTKEAGYEAAVTVSGVNQGYFIRADRMFTLDRYAVEWGDDLDTIARWKRF